jgi:DeoR/GlpR family transcriptional regulator of sugar metabolism
MANGMDATMVNDRNGADGRGSRQAARQRAICEAVMAEGAIRIDELAERFDISLMTVHRDLDELESRALIRKSRGVATALSSSLVESSDVFRLGQQQEEKESLARAVLDYIEPGQAILLDDSTTVLKLVELLPEKTPLTVITNVLTIMNKLAHVRGISLLALGGNYYNWCSAFMGRMTNEAISALRADTFIMSTSAITDDTCFHQTLETVDTKRAMFDAAATRILLVDHTKFAKRALHALAHLTEYDLVIVDNKTDASHIMRLRKQGVNVVVAPSAHSHPPNAGA